MVVKSLKEVKTFTAHSGTVFIQQFYDKEFQSGLLFCNVSTIKPGVTMEPHTHKDSEEVYYVLEGKATVGVGKERREVSPGDAILIPVNHEHTVINNSDGDFKIFVFAASMKK